MATKNKLYYVLTEELKEAYNTPASIITYAELITFGKEWGYDDNDAFTELTTTGKTLTISMQPHLIIK